MSSTPEQDTPEAASLTVEAVDENIAIIARQAIVDESRAVYGYELFDRSTASDAHTAASDAALLFNALSYAGTEALVGKKTVFINCTHDSLSGGHLELIHPEKVVLEVDAPERRGVLQVGGHAIVGTRPRDDRPTANQCRRSLGRLM